MNRPLLKTLHSDYKVYVKPFVLEEPLDYVFFRPFAFGLIKLTEGLNLKPDHFSFLAFLSAVVSYLGLRTGTSVGFLIGGLGILVFSILDCCDGMVARVKKNGSKYGEQVDMFVDLISNILFFTGIYQGIKVANGFIVYEYLIWVSSLFLLIHASVYRYFKEQFSFYADGNPRGRMEKLNNYRDDLIELNKERGRYFDKLLLNLYLGFSRAQKNPENFQYYDEIQYTKVNKAVLPMWGVISGSTHLFILAFSLIFYRIGLYFWFAIILGNLWLMLTLLIQVGVNSTIGAEK